MNILLIGKPAFLLAISLFFTCCESYNNVTCQNIGNTSAGDGYSLINKITWPKNENCLYEATLSVSKLRLIDLPDDQPKTIFEIKDTCDKNVILREDFTSTGLALKLENWTDSEHKTILMTAAAGSAENIELYLTGEHGVEKIFENSYRDFYLATQLYENDKSEFVIFLADNDTEGDNRYMVTKWKWDGKEFKKIGKVEYESFIKLLNSQT